MGSMESRGGPQENSPVSEVSGGAEGWTQARAASPLDPQGAPGHPPGSEGILDKMLLKAMEMSDTLLM